MRSDAPPVTLQITNQHDVNMVVHIQLTLVSLVQEVQDQGQRPLRQVLRS